MGGDLRKDQQSLRRTGLEVFGCAGALRAAQHRRRMLGPGGPGDRRPAGLGRRSSVLVVAASTFAETYRAPRRGSGEALSTEDIVFDTPDGELRMILVKAQGVGLVGFGVRSEE